MIDEEKVTENETPDAPVTEAAPESATETTTADPYAGKSADDLKSMLKEAQKQIGKQSTEVGEVRKLREEMESLKQVITRPRFDEGVFQPQPPPPPKEDDFDFADVPGSVKKLLARELNQREQMTAQQRAAQDANDARFAFENGKKAAYRDNPELYKGIENIIEGQLQNAWKVRAADKNMLSDPEIWRKAAIIIRDSRGELESVLGRKTVRPTQTETPTSRRQVADEDSDITWSRADREYMERNELTEKEAAEVLGLGKKMHDSGQLRWAGR